MTNQQLYLESKALFTRLNSMTSKRAFEIAKKAFWRMCRRAHTCKYPNGEPEE